MPYQSDMPFSRFGTHPTSPKDARDHRVETYLRSGVMKASALPIMVGTINRDVAPRIRQQGDEGSCTGHGFRTTKVIVERRNRKGSARNGVPDFGPRGIYEWAKEVGGYPEEEGAYLRDVVKAATNKGVPREKDWPYVAGRANRGTPGKSLDRYAKNWRIGAYARLRTLDEILTTLHTVGPAFMAMALHDSFFETGKDGIVPDPRGQEAGGHCMAIILADQETKRFLVPNSWGTNFGAEGYCWIGWDHFLTKSASEAWAIPDAV